ncbi:MAG: class I SAM-dependent methyltransferase [Nitrospinae bacterium]|nr:class I SAM-dependent methyltransferase [Nitrospinota bacterium]
MKKALNFFLRYFYALVSCLYVFTIGFFSIKNRLFITDIAEKYGYKTQRILPEIPETSLEEILKTEESVVIKEAIAVDGNVSLFEVYVMNRIVKKYNPTAIFEIGTFDGRTTLNMAANAQEGTQICTLDLPGKELGNTGLPVLKADHKYIDKASSGNRFMNTPFAKNITQLFGDSATFDFTGHQAKYDLVFVDGAHSYEYALNDTEVALKLLKKSGGVIVYHDYNGAFEGVTQALNELYLNREGFNRLRHIKDTSIVFLEV